MPVAERSGRSEADATSVFTGYPWEGVARLVDRAPSIGDLLAHRLELVGAARLRERGLPVPAELQREVRRAHLANVTAAALVKRIRQIYTGPLLVFKGLEAAACYPAPALRPFGDVDVVVPDAVEVQHMLEAAGFRPVGRELDWDLLHHLPRLAPPDLPFAVEVHKRPKWVSGLRTPRTDELFADAVPSAVAVDGVFAPAPAMHAVLLAAHAWSERPLGCIGDLLDVAAVAAKSPEGEAEELAARYGLERVWRTTIAATDALLGSGAGTWPLRTWARHLPLVRGQTVFESHVERALSPFAALPVARAVREAGRGLGRTVLPARDESWGAKLRRAGRAFRHAFLRRSDHVRSLEDEDDRL